MFLDTTQTHHQCKVGMASHDEDYENCLVFRPSAKNIFEPVPAQKVKMMQSYQNTISIVLNATTMWLIPNDGKHSMTELITLDKGSIEILSHVTKVECDFSTVLILHPFRLLNFVNEKKDVIPLFLKRHNFFSC